MLRSTRKAFTLIELIVVIVILGILALIAIPTFAKVIEKAKLQSVKRAAESLDREANALAAFDQAASNDTVITTDAAGTKGAFAANYVGAAAADFATNSGVTVTPVTGDATNTKYTVTKDGQSVVLTVSGTLGVSGTLDK